MLNRLDLKIVLAGATMLIGVAPALAYGGGSAGYSSHSTARSVLPPSLSAPHPRERLWVHDP
jgi:hypothetical protein